jgi:hypothetical protein
MYKKHDKKIGIVTWFFAPNYGTVLQAFALNKILERYYYKAEFVNYKRSLIKFEKIRDPFCFLFPGTIKKYLPQQYEKFIFFSFVKENLPITDKMFTKNNIHLLNSRYDIFICGSDQIWSPILFDDIFFLSFVKNHKKIAYAPSIGTYKIPKKLELLYKKLLGDFSFLSVREQDGADIISALINIKPQVVVDPTLLLTSEDWTHLIIPDESNICGQYILCYFLGNSDFYLKYVEQLKEKYNLKVITIKLSYTSFCYGDSILYNISPERYLFLIKNAAYICTDSYHGTIFSILFEKMFFHLLRFSDSDSISQNSRIYSLLEMLDLTDAIIDKNNIKFSFNADYDGVQRELDVLRADSLKYLLSALEN